MFVVRALCGLVLTCGLAAQPAKILVVGGANNHDHAWTTASLAEILAECGKFEVETTTTPAEKLAKPENIAEFAAFVLDYNGPRWGEAAERTFLDAVRGGTGVAVVHAANNAFPGWVEYEKMVGLCWRRGTGHGRFHPYDVEVVDHYHPITHGMSKLVKHPDELYHRLRHMHGVELRVLLSAYSDPKTGGTGRHEPMAVVLSYGDGRVFHTPLGHVWKGVPASRASHLDPQFRRLVCRGTEWAATGRVTMSPQPLGWLDPEERRQGFKLLFDGKAMSEWRGYRKDGLPAKGWVVEDGAIFHRPRGGGGDLITRAQFGDFELRFEWKVAKGANSGVIYRVTEDEGATYMTGPEFQVLDDGAHDLKPAAKIGAGALYALQCLAGKRLRPVGEYNRGRIVLRGWHVQHFVNGKKVVDLDLAGDEGSKLIANSKFKAWSKFARNPRGHIALQDHGDGVWYRNVRIREMGRAEERK